jgi:N-acetylglucosaminyl-diphospho-decaprenol L-rhamnosyltransferase
VDAAQAPVHEVGAPAAEPRWAAVVVNYEAGALLEQCVRSVLADDSAGPAELVVVDNASGDGSADALVKALPGVRVVRAGRNLGYARAVNLGVAATRAPVVAALNADTRLGRGTAAAMLARLDSQPRLAACGPRVKNTDGSDYPSARVDPSIPVAVMHGLLGVRWPGNRFTARYRQLDAEPTRPRAVDWVSGAAIWLRRQALDDVGGWDERYFMYFEDVDLCHRLRRSGWDVAYEPAGVVWHVQGASTARRPYRMLAEHHRSAWRFARRRLTGVRAALLPLVLVYLAARASAAIAARAWAGRRAATG